MTQATAPPSKMRSLARRIYDETAGNPAVAGIVLYGIVAMAATVAAYFSIFTEFMPYDDEGTLLVTLKAFVHGDALYHHIWSVYGPFYYELFGSFFALTGHPITTNASRLIVVVIWVGTSLLFGLAAQRLTGRLALGVAGMIAAFSTLSVLTNEPMHPQGLCVLLLGAFSLLAVSGQKGRTAWVGGGCGALVAALILTKVNLGIFAIAAVVLAGVLTIEPLRRRHWIRLPVIAAFLALPVLVLERDLGMSWVRELLLLEALAATAVIAASWPLQIEREGGGRIVLQWTIAAMAGFVLAFIAIIAIILFTGPSLGDVYQGVVVQAFQIRNVLMSPFLFPPGAALDWAIGAVVAAIVATRLRLADPEHPSIWPGLLRAVAGLVIWLTVAHMVPIALNPSSANPDLLPMLLAWVAVIPPIGVHEPEYKRFLRVLLPALAVAESLQIYPVAGSQMGIAAVSFVSVGALCLGDALTDLRAWSSARGALHLANFRMVAAVGTVALAGMFALNLLVLPGINNAIVYRDQPKLELPGADLMHLPATSVATYMELVDLLHRYNCTTFIGYPPVNSLFLWSGLEAPPPQPPNAWVYALDQSQQQQALAALRASPRPCAIHDEGLTDSYLHGQPPPDLPLVNYVLHDFRRVATVESFDFFVPKPVATTR